MLSRVSLVLESWKVPQLDLDRLSSQAHDYVLYVPVEPGARSATSSVTTSAILLQSFDR